MSRTIIEREFWNDEQVIDEYSPEDKLFMMYLLTCPRGNSIGIFKLPIKLMAFEIGYSPESTRTLIDRFMNKYTRITYDFEEQEIAIHNAMKYTINRGGRPIEEMVTRTLEEVSSLHLIERVYENMIDWWELSKRDVDKSIKTIFEQEISKRNYILNTNTYTNTYTYTYTHTPTESVPDTEEVEDFNISEKNKLYSDTVHDTSTDTLPDTAKQPQSNWKTQIMNEWNKLDGNIPKIQSLNPGTDRYKMLKARISEYSLDDVLKAIKTIDNSRFLKGYISTWNATFDWFVKPSNFVKVLEGTYDDKTKQEPEKEESIADIARQRRLNRLNNQEKK